MKKETQMEDDIKTTGLLDFLISNPQDNVEAMIRLSDRFGDLKFKISGMSSKQVDRYREEAQIVSKKGEFNNRRFHEVIVINHLVEPDLKDIATVSKAGVTTAEDFLNKFFKPGEVTELALQIIKLSGFDGSEDVYVEEVKN